MLALICGTGHLPAAIAAAQAEHPLVCVLQGFAPEGLAADITFRLEHLGTFLQQLHARGVARLCLCGAISRPRLDPAALDEATRPLVPQLTDAMRQGDDGALRGIIAILEAAGFAIEGVETLAPGILPGPGTLTVAKPRRETRADVFAAQAALPEMAARDEGQACIVRLGDVVALEGQSGTDAMLADHAQRGLPGGILYKGPKPGQERRADLPTIGPDTARGVIAAGLDGIVIEAGGVIVLERALLLSTLDAGGRFLWAVAP